MSESDQPQSTPPAQGDPSGGEPEGQPADRGPVDLDSETADERNERKLRSYQEDQERLRQEHGQS